uniref:GST C-terminal domain-containing protein n=1 Tax=Timema shepardi TaxID=629360 RepID=A0A7R9AT27_TIMSH|nr:unnamed protein product [Timema shepardi]
MRRNSCDWLRARHLTPVSVLRWFFGDRVNPHRAIMGYFVNQYAKDDSLYPKDPKKRAMVDQKLYFDIGTLYQRFLNYFVSINLMPIAWKGMKPDAEALEKLEEAVGFLNSYLEGQGWVAGEDISIADYAIAVTMSNIEVREQAD